MRIKRRLSYEVPHFSPESVTKLESVDEMCEGGRLISAINLKKPATGSGWEEAREHYSSPAVIMP